MMVLVVILGIIYQILIIIIAILTFVTINSRAEAGTQVCASGKRSVTWLGRGLVRANTIV